MNKQARQGAPQSGVQNAALEAAGVITMHQLAPSKNSHAKKAAAVIA